MKRNYFLACNSLAFLLVATLCGCDSQDESRVRVHGTVSYNGAPVPSGYITFDPDVSKGNSGAQGSAMIREGKFDTDAIAGRRPVAGSVVVTIHCYDGSDESEHPYGKRTIEPQVQTIELAPEENEIELVAGKGAAT